MYKDNITVAVIIPIHQYPLNRYEKISINRCLNVLKRHEIIVIVPQDLKTGKLINDLMEIRNDIRIEKFENKYFKSINTYSELMLSKLFYERFKDHTYILIHQLDCLVINDSLLEWCQKGYDYIGAPWFVGFDREKSNKLFGVGNGGFSLRKVETFLKVLSSHEVHNHNDEIETIMVGYGLKNIVILKLLFFLKRYFNNLNYLKLYLFFFTSYEDIFWSAYSKFFIVQDFKIPTIKEALEFSFEVNPRYCYELNNHNYPFGCHAWYKHDKDFWLDLLNSSEAVGSNAAGPKEKTDP